MKRWLVLWKYIANSFSRTSGWGVIPIVITPDKTIIQDSALIIDYFEQKYPLNKSVYPIGAKQRLVASILELFGDEFLKMPAMHYRWNFHSQMEFMKHEWGISLLPRASTLDMDKVRSTAEASMSSFATSLPVLGVSESTIPGIDTTYKEFLFILNRHLSAHRYILGDIPSIGVSMCLKSWFEFEISCIGFRAVWSNVCTLV